MRGLNITLERLMDIKSFLESLEVQEKKVFSKKEAVVFLKTTIEELFAKNYTAEEISNFLKDKGFDISASTLRKWVMEGSKKRETIKNTKNRKSGTHKIIPKELNKAKKEENIKPAETKVSVVEIQDQVSARFTITEDTPL